LFLDLTTNDQYTEFLTLPAYEFITGDTLVERHDDGVPQPSYV
jgi:hypothetical protein